MYMHLIPVDMGKSMFFLTINSEAINWLCKTKTITLSLRLRLHLFLLLPVLQYLELTQIPLIYRKYTPLQSSYTSPSFEITSLTRQNTGKNNLSIRSSLSKSKFCFVLFLKHLQAGHSPRFQAYKDDVQGPVPILSQPGRHT